MDKYFKNFILFTYAEAKRVFEIKQRLNRLLLEQTIKQLRLVFQIISCGLLNTQAKQNVTTNSFTVTKRATNNRIIE